MRRNESLPSIHSERGTGLAELKGRDPMDRRIEVEKQEKYAQALREQMASRRGNGKDEHRPGSPGFGSGGSRLPSPNLSHGGAEVFNVESSSVTSASPYSPPSDRGHKTGQGAYEMMHNRDTSDKLAQVQEIMRQRLQALQEEQHRQWDRIQAQLRENAGFARDAAEKAVSKQIESALEAQIRPMLGDLAAARREYEAQALRVNEAVQDMSSLRQWVDRLQSQSEDHGRQLSIHQAEIDRLKMAQEDCERFKADIDRDLRALSDAVASVRTEQNNQAARIAEILRTLGEHTTAIDHLRRAHEDCKRYRAEALEDRRAVHDALAKVKAQQDDIARQIAEVPNLIKKLRDEVTRIAERAAHDICQRMRPAPQPLIQSPPPPPVAPDVSEQAFAVLRNSDGELYELPALQNIIGRSPACHASITSSQAISNRHASLDFDAEGRASIRDLDSRNGTFLNEKRVPKDAGFVLESGACIQLGVDGPAYTFEFGPAYYARWPSNPIKVRARSNGPGRR